MIIITIPIIMIQGDSGGPLMLYDESVSSWLLIGIVSFGNRLYKENIEWNGNDSNKNFCMLHTWEI